MDLINPKNKIMYYEMIDNSIRSTKHFLLFFSVDRNRGVVAAPVPTPKIRDLFRAIPTCRSFLSDPIMTRQSLIRTN